MRSGSRRNESSGFRHPPGTQTHLVALVGLVEQRATGAGGRRARYSQTTFPFVCSHGAGRGSASSAAAAVTTRTHPCLQHSSRQMLSYVLGDVHHLTLLIKLQGEATCCVSANARSSASLASRQRFESSPWRRSTAEIRAAQKLSAHWPSSPATLRTQLGYRAQPLMLQLSPDHCASAA